MKMRPAAPALMILGLLCSPSTAAAQPVFPLEVVVTNVKKAVGTIRVAVCTRQTFLKDCAPYEATAPARVPTTTLVVPALPAGEYAAQIFQDENNNHEVDRGLLGLPREGIGFSNDAPIKMASPKFRDAAFQVEGAGTIRITLRHMVKLP